MATAPLEIRRATRRDQGAMRALHRALYVDYHRAITPKRVAELSAYRDLDAALDADVEALLGRPEMRVLLAERAGETVGYVTAKVTHDPRRVLAKRAAVEDWLVVEDERGHGVGRALMEALFAMLEAEGCEVVESTTVVRNAGSRAAHAQLGFIETEVRMRKRLAPGATATKKPKPRRRSGGTGS